MSNRLFRQAGKILPSDFFWHVLPESQRENAEFRRWAMEREGCVSYFCAYERSRLFISDSELDHYLSDNLSPASYPLEVAACSRSLDISMADLAGWTDIASGFPTSEWFYALFLDIVADTLGADDSLEQAIALVLERQEIVARQDSVIRPESRTSLGLILVFAIVWVPVLVRWMFG